MSHSIPWKESHTQTIPVRTKVFLFVVLYVFLGGFVFFEPSPAEWFFLCFVPFLLPHLRFSRLVLGFSFALLISLIISAINGSMSNWVNTRYLIIDFYLIALFLVIPSLVINKRMFNSLLLPIFRAWTVAAVVNLCLYAYAVMTGNTVVFGTAIVRFGIRFTGFFKDPNVLGPFMVVPALFWIFRFLEQDKKHFSDLFLGVVLSAGVFLSFSRGAWLNFIVVFSLSLFYSTMKNRKLISSLLVLLVACSFVGLIFLGDLSVLGVHIGDFTAGRFGVQKYDLQRFEAQRGFVEMVKLYPLFGVGPGNYTRITAMGAHSTFTRLLGERGIIGFSLSMMLFMMAIHRSYRLKPFLAFALLGIMANSLFVDTWHWRHLWLIISFSLIPQAGEKEGIGYDYG